MANREKRSAREPQIGSPPTVQDLTVKEQRGPIDEMVPTHADTALPMVGLGGGAGTLEPLQRFLRALPADSGMGFVVLLQLAPEEERTLPERLQRCTKMPVVRARNGTQMERNKVYVIPYDQYVRSVDRRLWL